MKPNYQHNQNQREQPQSSRPQEQAIRPHHEGAVVEVEERSGSRTISRRVVVGRYTVGPSGRRKPIAQ